MTEYAFEGLVQPSTQISWSFATQTLSADRTVPFSRPIDAAYQNTIQAAFNRWSAVSGVTFVQVPDSASVRIRVGFGSFTGVEIGETDYLAGSAYFKPDVVLRLMDPAVLALSQNSAGVYTYSSVGVSLYQVVLHEIGHTLGLAHTTDPATIMYPVATTANPDLTAGDIEGANALYPLYTVAALNPEQLEGSAGTTPFSFQITRYSDPSLAITLRYQVTPEADPAVAGSLPAAAARFPGGAYPSGQITFAAGVSTVTLTVPVAADTLPEPDAAFRLTVSSVAGAPLATERGTPDALIVDDDGNTTVSGNTLGVFRFFDTTDGTHFYTENFAERNALLTTRPDLVYEGATLSAVSNPASPGATPVFRFFEQTNGTHFYTDSTAERDAVGTSRPDLNFEGVAFYEHAAPQAGDVPVYRFFSQTDGTHFFTESSAERQTLLATRPDLVNEGIAFYAPSA